MNEHDNKVVDKSILGVLKPGDILVVEAQKPLSAARYKDLKAHFESAAQDLQIKILVLPYGIRAVKIRTDDSDTSLARG